MTRALARRADIARTGPNGYIRSCTFNYGYHEYESDYGVREMFRSGHDTIDTELVINGAVQSQDFESLMEHPVVFEWPEAEQFIAMQVRSVRVTHHTETVTVVDVHGVVLGIAEYGKGRLTRQDASVKVQKLLTA
jgi:hypothetical protein